MLVNFQKLFVHSQLFMIKRLQLHFHCYAQSIAVIIDISGFGLCKLWQTQKTLKCCRAQLIHFNLYNYSFQILMGCSTPWSFSKQNSPSPDITGIHGKQLLKIHCIRHWFMCKHSLHPCKSSICLAILLVFTQKVYKSSYRKVRNAQSNLVSSILLLGTGQLLIAPTLVVISLTCPRQGTGFWYDQKHSLKIHCQISSYQLAKEFTNLVKVSTPHISVNYNIICKCHFKGHEHSASTVARFNKSGIHHT